MAEDFYSDSFRVRLYRAADAPTQEWVVGYWVDDFGSLGGGRFPSYKDRRNDWWRAGVGHDHDGMPVVHALGNTPPHGWKPL